MSDLIFIGPGLGSKNREGFLTENHERWQSGRGDPGQPPTPQLHPARIDGLSIFALILLIVVFLVLAYGMIIMHDIPYHIAVKRKHPHQDTIHYAGWVSLFTLHAIWPFLWIWATMYRPERGYGFGGASADPAVAEKLKSLEERLAELEANKNPS